MSRGGSKLVSWFWRAPRRALGRARDFYVRSLTSCAGHLPSDAGYGYPTFAATPMPYRSDSFASSRRSSSFDDDDLRELIRAASQRRAAEAAAAAEPPAVTRSQSVAMARIDEDGPCEFAGAAAGFSRSRSCAVGAGGRVAALSWRSRA